MNPRKKIAIIGGGFAGIGSIAHLKAEGLHPVCFEKSDKCGGTWCFRETSQYGQASIMPTTIINHSKEMGALSNFPPKKEYNNYMRHDELYQYLTDYAKHHDCYRYIHYNMQVVKVERGEDYYDSGRWYVTTKNLNTHEVKKELFDGVIVATGHINMPKIPDYPDQRTYRGKIMHTHSLKEVEEFAGQNVVIVGTGCSALDAAVEISRVAKQVYLSTRSGAVIINRVGLNGYPIDYTLLRRYITWCLDYLPTSVCSWYLETFYLDKPFDHRLFYRQPKYHFLAKDPILNDHIAAKILTGSVIQKGDIKYFTEDGIQFDGDEDVTSVDTVIMATGYTWGFPFLEDGVIVCEKNIINLYKCMYPPHLPHPTLAFIAFILPFGPGFPLGELQIRWASYLLAGHGKLPSKDVMLKDIMKRHSANEKRYAPSDKMTVKVDYVQYMDEIAVELGVKPNLLKYLFIDLPLFLKLVFGPCLSYQYRLDGHGKWDGAREAIMTCSDRIHFPLIKKRAFKDGILHYVVEYIAGIISTFLHIFNY